MDQLPAELNLVTLNCWGLRYGLSRLRTERLSEIGRQLAALDPAPHIVALQECWSEAEDYAAIRRETAAILPHGKFYHAGAFGAGLAILSQWPIEETSMIRFPLSGRPTAFFRGDWFVGKGVASATMRIGPSPHHVVQVFNTHVSLFERPWRHVCRWESAAG
jgi:sphingomyelin phosphodiesterase 2